MMDQHCGPEVLSSCFNPVQGILPLWSELPSVVLENIYSYLNRKDRIEMSLVCKPWAQEYSAPSLWKNIKFVFNEIKCTTGICPEVKFAQKYAHMYHHVEITCNRHSTDLEIKCRQLELFLQALTNHSQLLSLSFRDMLLYVRRYALESILNLLSAQSKLKSLEFKNVFFQINEAANVFRVICAQNNSNLKSLKLENFIEEFPENVNDFNIIQNLSIFDILINLREIVIDYSQILENIIMTWSKYVDSMHEWQIKSCLERMKILCFGSSSLNYRGIPSLAWKILSKKLPALKIDLSFHAIDINALEVFVTNYMPVRSLNFKTHNNCLLANEIGSMLRHIVLCHINTCLEELDTTCVKDNNLTRELIHFLESCPRLRVLQLHILHPIYGLDDVFNFWLENGKKSIEFVHITVTWVERTKWCSKYLFLQNKYAPLLQEQGINLIFLIDYKYTISDYERFR